ncbi:MAG: FecR domain-containing protein, partial [Nitrosomonadaceae bacterium]
TRARSSMGITLKDATVISLGPETEFAIDEYAYAPAKNKLKLSSRITKGSLNYVSGIIAKLQPEAVKIKTPAGTIGVRGTKFAVKVE